MPHNNNKRHSRLKPLAVAVALSAAGGAQAVTFDVGDEWKGEWNTTLSVGSQWRSEEASNKLYSGANGRSVGKQGGLSGRIDPGNLNYDKGDRFSSIGKFVTDVSLRNGDLGGLVRVKGWYDQALEDEDVNLGSISNGYQKHSPLSDDGYEDLQKYKGVYLLDAYVYDTFYIDESPLQVRLGRQVVNWGESLYIQGLNQISPLDVPALRRPGTELKEALIPVWMGYFNLGLPAGISMEGFYQLKYESTAVEGCGHYWSVTESAIARDPGSCDVGITLGNPNTLTSAQAINAGAYLPLNKGKDPKDSGQWGLALRIPVDALDGEVGVYYMNYHSRTPYLAIRNDAPTVPEQFPNAPAGGALGGIGPSWEYPEDIRLYGISFTTTVKSWSLAGELSHSPNQPVQLNGADLLNGALGGVGPLAQLQQSVVGQRVALTEGWNRFEKTQLQLNAVNLFPNVFGAENLTVVGEVGFQWNNVPDFKDNERYGRSFIFGFGAAPSTGALGSLGNTQPDGAKNDGYVTDFSWGYRLRGQLDYSNFLGTSVTASPFVFLGQDVEGVSMDGQFNEGRLTESVGLSFDYNKQHKIDLSYVTFDNSAQYDPLRDHDFFAASYSYSF
ncbi:hypothetical protein D3C76_578720 [compost metagenome]